MTTPTTVKVQLKLRQDTSSGWSTANPILLAGELGRESNTGKIKIGNGSTAWNSLSYQPFGALITNDDISATAEIAVSKLADGAARQLLQTDAAGTGVEWTNNVDIPGTLDVTGVATFDAAVTVAGDLTVNGTTTTISTQNLLVEDKNIIIGDVASPTDVTADGGGITLKGATDKTINWIDATDAWTSSERFSVPLGSAAAPSLTFTGDPNTGLYSPGADQVAISTNSAERMRITATGVGVGTSSPSYPFHIANGAIGVTSFSNSIDGAGEVGLLLRGQNGSHNTSLLFSSSNTNVRTRQYFNVADGSLRWDTSSDGTTFNSRLYLSTAGNVGIGTTSPSYLLDVISSASSTIRSASSETSGSNIGQFVAEYAGSGGTNAQLTLRAGASYGLVGTVTNSPLLFAANGSERARIDSSGRLLVGTSSISTNNAIVAVQGRSDSSTAGGKLLIAKGPGDPVDGGSLGSLLFSGSNYSDSATIGANRDGGTWTAGSSQPSRLVFSTTANGASSPTERMRITSAGNVGIGTASPGAVLHSAVSSGAVVFRGSHNNTGLDLYANDATGEARITSARLGGSGGKFISFYTDTGTGEFERARIDSSGRLLVGTSAGVSAAFVNSSIQAHGFTGDNSSITLYRFTTSATAAATPRLVMARSGSDSKDFTAVASGNRLGQLNFVGADGTQFVSAASIDCEVDGTPGANDMPGRLVFSTTADGASSPTERIRITSAGTIRIGQTSTDTPGNGNTTTGIGMEPANGALFLSRGEGSGNLFLNSNLSTGTATAVTFKRSDVAIGSITTTTTSTSYNTSSDYRLKENVISVTDGITRLRQLKPSRFNFIADPTKTVDGFLAHEVQAIVPEAVTGEKDALDDEGNPQYQGIDQSKLVPLLTAALQEAVAKIESLEARLTAAGL